VGLKVLAESVAKPVYQTFPARRVPLVLVVRRAKPEFLMFLDFVGTVVNVVQQV
jgi:hypothetical protein